MGKGKRLRKQKQIQEFFDLVEGSIEILVANDQLTEAAGKTILSDFFAQKIPPERIIEICETAADLVANQMETMLDSAFSRMDPFIAVSRQLVLAVEAKDEQLTTALSEQATNLFFFDENDTEDTGEYTSVHQLCEMVGDAVADTVIPKVKPEYQEFGLLVQTEVLNTLALAVREQFNEPGAVLLTWAVMLASGNADLHQKASKKLENWVYAQKARPPYSIFPPPFTEEDDTTEVWQNFAKTAGVPLSQVAITLAQMFLFVRQYGSEERYSYALEYEENANRLETIM